MFLRKSIVNLQRVVDSICEIDFSNGSFDSQFFNDGKCVLLKSRRNSIGKAVLGMIPNNWRYNVQFEDGVIFLVIWI